MNMFMGRAAAVRNGFNGKVMQISNVVPAVCSETISD